MSFEDFLEFQNNLIYTKGVAWRDFPQFHKFQYILKVSLQETPSTIPKNWIYTKSVSWKDTFHNSTKSNMY